MKETDTKAIRAVLGSSMAAMQALDAYLAGAQAPLQQQDLPMGDVATAAKAYRAQGMTYRKVGEALARDGHLSPTGKVLSSGVCHRLVVGGSTSPTTTKVLRAGWQAMEVTLPPELIEKTNVAARKMHRSPSYIVARAVCAYLEKNKT